MQMRALAGLAMAAAVAWSGSARAAERPTAEAIRAAAKAVAPAVVDVEAAVRQWGGVVPDIRVWPPGQEIPQPRGRQWQWQWQWEWPPRGGDRPENMPKLPDVFQLPRGMLGGPRRGAGLIVAVEGERGLVAVPAEAVRGVKEAKVRLADGRELDGKVLGSDGVTGTACIEIQAPGLAAATPAKPGAVQAGDWVLAVGGPATGRALAIGIVSAVGRPGEGEMAATELIHTDVTVSDAMAGAPLVTLSGEVIGTILPRRQARRQAAALTAAVPVATAQATVEAIAKEGKVRRALLGITYRPLPPDERERLGIEGGVEVQNVVPGGAAEKGGLRQGDVIVEFAGKKVEPETFRALVAARKPGERVAVKVLRGGEEVFAEVTLGERDGEGEPRAEAPRPAPEAAGGKKAGLGLSLQPLTPELAEAFGFGGDKGLLVTAVEPDSPAAKGRPQGVRRGDLIKEIARKTVTTLDEAKQAIKQAREAKAKNVLLLVRGRDGTRYIVVDLPQ